MAEMSADQMAASTAGQKDSKLVDLTVFHLDECLDYYLAVQKADWSVERLVEWLVVTSVGCWVDRKGCSLADWKVGVTGNGLADQRDCVSVDWKVELLVVQ